MAYLTDMAALAIPPTPQSSNRFASTNPPRVRLVFSNNPTLHPRRTPSASVPIVSYSDEGRIKLAIHVTKPLQSENNTITKRQTRQKNKSPRDKRRKLHPSPPETPRKNGLTKDLHTHRDPYRMDQKARNAIQVALKEGNGKLTKDFILLSLIGCGGCGAVLGAIRKKDKLPV